jgi:hypothetical protein
MNSADKRQVTTDALQTLGTIIGETEARDAIHLAVEPVVAVHPLKPGEDVGFVDGGVGVCANPVGIVDPFLKQRVKAGERFWLVVYPRQITSLRHVWSHPAFDDQSARKVDDKETTLKTASKRWLDDYAANLIVDLDDLIYHAREYVEDKRNGGWGNFWIEGGRFEGVSLPEEFWDHFERYTGEKVTQNERGYFFSCSC